MTIATDVPSAPQPAPSQPPPKKSSLGRKILKLFVLLLIVVVLGVIILYLNLNTLVRAGVIRGGMYATDQATGLQAADLSLSAGSLKLSDFDIANLKDYHEPKILTMKSCATSVQSGSLFTDTVVVDSIVIDGLEVTLEQNGMKNNLNDLMDTINKKTAATGNTQNTSPGKKLKIAVIKLTNSKVHVRSGAPLNINMDLDLPPLQITDPTNPDGRPMKIADLIGQIMLHLSKEIVENPAIPGDIKGAMGNVTKLVDNLRGQLDKNAKVLTENLQNLGKNLDLKNLPDAGKGVQDATKGLQDAGKGLQDMFNKKPQQPAK